MNNIQLTGRLTKDPEMRNTKNGVSVTNFSIAVLRPGTSKENAITDFFDCVAWGGKDGPGRAGAIEKYFHKGDGIIISKAIMQQKKWTDNDGNVRTGYDVNVLDWEFPMSKKPDNAAQTPQTAEERPANFTPVAADDSLPF